MSPLSLFYKPRDLIDYLIRPISLYPLYALAAAEIQAKVAIREYWAINSKGEQQLYVLDPTGGSWIEAEAACP